MQVLYESCCGLDVHKKSITACIITPKRKEIKTFSTIAPGNNESAGKKRSGKIRKRNKSLRCTLVEAARSAARTKNTYLSAQYHRIAARRGANRACVAVAHTILTIVYYILKRRQPYLEMGANYFESRKKDFIIKQSIKKLEAFGFQTCNFLKKSKFTGLLW